MCIGRDVVVLCVVLRALATADFREIGPETDMKHSAFFGGYGGAGVAFFPSRSCSRNQAFRRIRLARQECHRCEVFVATALDRRVRKDRSAAESTAESVVSKENGDVIAAVFPSLKRRHAWYGRAQKYPVRAGAYGVCLIQRSHREE